MSNFHQALSSITEIREALNKLEVLIRKHPEYLEVSDLHDELLNLASETEGLIMSHLSE
jgi:hypothetical protein